MRPAERPLPPMTAMPVAMTPAPMATTPSPVTAAPAPMPAVPTTSPAHLLGLEAFHLGACGDGGPDLRAAGRPRVFQRMRHKRRRLRADRKRSRARGNSNGNLKKVAAFHESPSGKVSGGESLMARR